MQATFLILGRSFSINATTGANKRYKTPECRDWETTVLHQLNSAENKQKFDKLRSHFDTSKHSYSVSIAVYYPEADFYTKKGIISAHTQDVSNYEKPLIDLIFLPKYFNLEGPYGCPNLNIDDKFITQMFSTKRVGPELCIKVRIRILKRRQ